MQRIFYKLEINVTKALYKCKCQLIFSYWGKTSQETNSSRDCLQKSKSVCKRVRQLSKNISATEQNYSTIKRECASIIYGIKKQRN